MTPNKIGGSGRQSAYLLLYAIGLILGFLIRLVAVIAPIGVVHRLKESLLPDGTAADGAHQL